MYINFWYVADQSQNITESPVKKKMLGQNFVLFRDTKGNVHFLNDDRANIKLEINNHTGSKIKEIKEYTNY